MFVIRGSQVQVVPRFLVAILADLTTRGLAISFLTLACIE
jgi:hypothetical protein